jgi:hypothetical protein
MMAASDADGTLRNDVAREIFGHFDAVPPVFAFRSQMRHRAEGVHVAKNEVAAEFLASCYRLLEIDARACAKPAAKCTKGSFGNGFSGKVSGEAAVVDSHNRQTAAVYGDAVCNRKRRTEGRHVNRDAAAIVMQIERFDGSKVFDDASEHVDGATSGIEFTAFRGEGRKQ